MIYFFMGFRSNRIIQGGDKSVMCTQNTFSFKIKNGIFFVVSVSISQFVTFDSWWICAPLEGTMELWTETQLNIGVARRVSAKKTTSIYKVYDFHRYNFMIV